MKTSPISPTSAKGKHGIDLRAVANIMARVGLLESEALSQPKDEGYFAGLKTVALGLFKLVVMGEIKKGKSSFINGICGIPDLVPVHSDVATSTVFKIHHGPERKYTKYTVFFQQRGEVAESKKLEIPLEQVKDYGTEDGNPKNIKGVDFIAVEAPSAILSDGLVILDTPGLGGLFKEHRDITFRYAPKADGIFFVTDIDAPIGADEVAFLKDLKRVTNLIFFVQTKAAKVGEEACRRRMENNIGILTEQAGFRREDIRYFVVDSKLKADADKAKSLEDLQDSGFAPLMQFLTGDLKRRKNLNLATVGLSRATMKLGGIKARVAGRREILLADTAEKQKALVEEAQKAEQALQDWVATTRGPLLTEFQQNLSADISGVHADLQLDLKPSGRIADAVASKVEAAIKGGSVDAQKLYESAPRLVQDARAAASESLIRHMRDLESRVSKLLAALSNKAGAQLVTRLSSEKAIKTFTDTGILSLAEIRLAPPDHDLFTTLRTGFLGMTAGAGIASVVGGIIGSVVPVVGTIVGSTLGIIIAAAWGGKKALELTGRQDLTAARREVLVAVDKDLGNMMVVANAEFSKTTRAIEAKSRDAIQEIIDQNQKRLTEQKKALQARAKSDRAELADEEKVVRALEKNISEIEQQIKAMEAAMQR